MQSGSDTRRKDLWLAPKQEADFSISFLLHYSTEQQDESSIADPITYCKKYLESLGFVLSQVTIVEITDTDLPQRTGVR